MKTEVWVLIVVAFIFLFVSGVNTGLMMKRADEYRKMQKYFDEYPSPLACHRDGTCGVKPCDLSEYKGDVVCK